MREVIQQIHNRKPPIILQPSQYEIEFSVFQSNDPCNLGNIIHPVVFEPAGGQCSRLDYQGQ